MCQLAVDFGKRSKCVTREDFQDLSKIVNKMDNERIKNYSKNNRNFKNEEDKLAFEKIDDKERVLICLKKSIKIEKFIKDYLR